MKSTFHTPPPSHSSEIFRAFRNKYTCFFSVILFSFLHFSHFQDSFRYIKIELSISHVDTGCQKHDNNCSKQCRNNTYARYCEGRIQM